MRKLRVVFAHQQQYFLQIWFCNVLENVALEVSQKLKLEHYVSKGTNYWKYASIISKTWIGAAIMALSPLLMVVIFCIRHRLIRRIGSCLSSSHKNLPLHQRIEKVCHFPIFYNFNCKRGYACEEENGSEHSLPDSNIPIPSSSRIFAMRYLLCDRSEPSHLVRTATAHDDKGDHC